MYAIARTRALTAALCQKPLPQLVDKLDALALLRAFVARVVCRSVSVSVFVCFVTNA